MKIARNRVDKGEGFNLLPETVRSMIDPGKKNSLLEDIRAGLNNSVLYRKFPGFSWPQWISGSSKEIPDNRTPFANPVLLNTTSRNWQMLSNYLSEGELRVDSSGMISGPGESRWSVEFWICSKNIFYRPASGNGSISASRDTKTGELEISGSYRGISFRQRMSGGRSSVNEAVVSYTASSRTDMTGSMLVVAVRPYNMVLLGGLSSVEFVNSGNLVKVNGRAHIASARRPDRVMAGSAAIGDITPEMFDGADSFRSECPLSMATMGLCFVLSGNSFEETFRISLDSGNDLPTGFKRKYEDTAKDFALLYSMKSGEGMTLELPDEKYMNVINQSRLTMLNINTGDYLPPDCSKSENLYFCVYALTRTGQLREAENMIKQMTSRMKLNAKKKDFSLSISAAYLVSAFNELFLHKRDSGFLQDNFPVMRMAGDYVYAFCTEIHGLTDLKTNTARYDLTGDPSERDILIFYLAMSGMSYLSRCMGIFGDESRFRNEADRLQTLVRDSFNRKRKAASVKSNDFTALAAFPERLYLSSTEEEYNKLFRNLFVSEDFPLIDRVYGVDMFSGLCVLNQMLAIRDDRFFDFLDKLLGYTDGFFTLPEYVNPSTGRGSWGNGNSKVLASLLLCIMRNVVFTETGDRLELFPVPDERFFSQGRRLKIDNAPSRFGTLSFTVESAGKEVRITFNTLPKYVPADIRINLPFETKILEGNDFIVKKKINNTYFINGWPSVIRFQAAGRTESS